jgi:DNA-binding MarR family transcriptional regulator
MKLTAEGQPYRPALPPLGEVIDFLRLIWRLDHALQQTSKRMQVSLGVTGPQRLVIRIVGRFPGVTAGQLAEILHVDPSTLTGVLKRLERRGLVARRSDPRDQRRALIGLTAKGRRVEAESPGSIEAAVRAALEELPPGAVLRSAEVLRALAARLEAPATESGPATARDRGAAAVRRRAGASPKRARIPRGRRSQSPRSRRPAASVPSERR